jgi:hypothetical protein
MEFYGVDKEGRPIQIIMSNGPGFKQLYENLSENELFELQLMMYERFERVVLPLCSQKAGKKVGKL